MRLEPFAMKPTTTTTKSKQKDESGNKRVEEKSETDIPLNFYIVFFGEDREQDFL